MFIGIGISVLIVIAILAVAGYLYDKKQTARMASMLDALGGATSSVFDGILNRPPDPVEGFGDSFDWVHTLLRDAKFYTHNVFSEERDRLFIRATRHGANYIDFDEVELVIVDPSLSTNPPPAENVRLTVWSSRPAALTEKEMWLTRATHDEIFGATFAAKLREKLLEACKVMQEL